jgi:hypothetical protein
MVIAVAGGALFGGVVATAILLLVGSFGVAMAIWTDEGRRVAGSAAVVVLNQ